MIFSQRIRKSLINLPVDLDLSMLEIIFRAASTKECASWGIPRNMDSSVYSSSEGDDNKSFTLRMKRIFKDLQKKIVTCNFQLTLHAMLSGERQAEF